METIIWHNPRCSKSRQTLALLEARGVEPHVVRYLDDPPSREEISFVIDKMGVEPRALMRTGEDLYKSMNLASVHDRELLINAMVEHPRLIERPVVIRGERVALGRPPESVLGVLD